MKYGDTENAHLSCLNGFIKECHDRMRSYFYDICIVQDSDEYFGIDEFSDFIVITKPVVYLTPKEICDTQKILLDYASIIAPDSQDPLSEILKLLGPDSNVDTLINSFTNDSNNNNRSLDTSNSLSTNSDMNESSIGRITQLCITLTPRYAPNGDEKTDLHNLYIKYASYFIFGISLSIIVFKFFLRKEQNVLSSIFYCVQVVAV